MIDFNSYAALVLQFLSENIFIGLALCAAIIFFFYKKPEETIKFLGFCIFLVAVVYIMSLLGESSSTGILKKTDMTLKSEQVIEESAQ